MFNLSSHNSAANRRPRLTRRLAAGLIATQLMLGTASVSALVSAAPASAATFLSQHGAWQGFFTADDGVTLVGARAEMTKGGTAAFVFHGDTLTLVLTDPDWDLKVNRHPPARVQIDGESFVGKAIVSGRDIVEIPNISMAVLKGFVDGAEAVVDINDGDIVWSFDLDGFTAAMSDALKSYKVSYE
ncbi:MAG: hypothetical protein WCC90_21325 [Methylocella sp.]